MSEESRTARRLAAILAADVAGYSRLMGADEEGTLAALKGHRRELVDPLIAQHQGRIVKTTGDGLLIEFASIVDAVRCAVVLQQGMKDRNANLDENQCIRFRIGINVGDIIVDEGDIFGDGVNVAARLEALAEPGEICVSATVREHVGEKLLIGFADLGEHIVKNIARPVHVYRIDTRVVPETAAPSKPEPAMLALPDRPSIAVLPFQNMSGDPEQEYFSDGMVEDIITGLSRIKWLFVIARNSSFVYKGKSIEVKRVGHELGVRYILEGSVRKASNRVRVTGQVVEAETGRHVWAERYDRTLEDIFALQDELTTSVVAAVSSHALRVKAVPAFGGIVSASPSDISITFGSGRAALLRNIVIEQALAALVLGAAAFLGTLSPSRGWINERGQGDATPTRSAKEMLGVARADPIDPCCVEPGEFDRGDG